MNAAIHTVSDVESAADDPGSAESPQPESSGPSDEPPPNSAAAHIEVFNAGDHRFSFTENEIAWLADRLRAAIEYIDQTFDRVTVRVIGDAEMRRLHARHCDDDTTTDVLTFPANDAGEPIVVDIAICADEAERAAEHAGHSTLRELLLYSLHGVLHCVGYDDHNESDFAAMHAEEDRILRAIGVGRTFHSGAGA